MDPSMLADFWNSPMIGQIAFPARKEAKGCNATAGTEDGEINVDGGVSVGYRLYTGLPASQLKAVGLYFHGNAEVCTDLGYGIDRFYSAGMAMLSVDFRGYGWSGGSPSFGALCPDADRVAAAMPAILAKAGLGALPVLLVGRSIGATAAVHLAAGAGAEQSFAGLLLEAGLMTVKDLPMLAPLTQMIPGAEMMLPMLPEPVSTMQKLTASTLPVRLTQAPSPPTHIRVGAHLPPSSATMPGTC
jgi:alpha-beta hydrolase superfamily lysophospholipase